MPKRIKEKIVPPLERIAFRQQIEKEDAAILEANAADPEKDSSGGCSSTLSLAYRFRGIAAYLLDKDIAKFHQFLKRAAMLKADVLRRYDSGEPIATSYVSMLTYKALFNALAVGAWAWPIYVTSEACQSTRSPL